MLTFSTTPLPARPTTVMPMPSIKRAVARCTPWMPHTSSARSNDAWSLAPASCRGARGRGDGRRSPLAARGRDRMRHRCIAHLAPDALQRGDALREQAPSWRLQRRVPFHVQAALPRRCAGRGDKPGRAPGGVPESAPLVGRDATAPAAAAGQTELLLVQLPHHAGGRRARHEQRARGRRRRQPARTRTAACHQAARQNSPGPQPHPSSTSVRGAGMACSSCLPTARGSPVASLPLAL